MKNAPEGFPIHEFWNDQAKTHGASGLATAPDRHYRTLEIESICRAIGAMKHDSILDVGCGNGFTAFEIENAFPDSDIVGVDFSSEMIK